MKTRKKGFFNPLKVKELRRKMLLIIGVMFIIRLLNQIPTPGVNHDYLKQILGGSGAMGFMDLMTGGSLSSLSILALNISPYITASIVIELLSIVFKQLDEMKRDGKHGQEELPDRFVPFFMWLDMHHPEPIDEEEKKILKRIRKILYTSVEITEETDGAL